MFKFLPNIIEAVFNRPATRKYPFEKRAPFTGSRGVLTIDPDVCIYCGICSRVCPSNAITVTMKDNKSWTLSPHKCILCALCVEKCPVKCMKMTPYVGDVSR